jgi:hypothetical protein
MQSFECAQIFNHFFLSIFLGTGAQKETEEFFLFSAGFLNWVSSILFSFKTVGTVILIPYIDFVEKRRTCAAPCFANASYLVNGAVTQVLSCVTLYCTSNLACQSKFSFLMQKLINLSQFFPAKLP